MSLKLHKTEYVYFIYDKHTKRTKIGKSTNVNKRLSGLKTSNPDLILVYHTNHKNEDYYHNLFKSKRIVREWFSLTHSDLKIVKGMETKKHGLIANGTLLKESEIDGYCFTNIEGLLWHSGKFWFNEKEVKEVYNNGSKSILIYGSKRSIKQLRKFASPCKIKLLTEMLPF